MTEIRTVACSNGHPIDEPVALAPEHRKPCPCCGSIARQYGQPLHATMKPVVSVQRTISKMIQATTQPLLWLRLKQKRPGVRGYLVDLISGWELRKSVGDLVLKFRRIDWGTTPKWYQERIELQSGEVTRDVSHPLKDHINRGSAKPKPSPPI
jgi:hypothetical protein